MNIATRILKSWQDGSFGVKLLNRVFRTRYVPSPETNLDRFLAGHYPGEGWKRLSRNAKQIWIDLSPLFAEIEIRNIAYVGAHEGEIAMAMDETFPGRHFYLIEPVPLTFQVLLANVSSRPNMRCFNLAAGAEDGEIDMFADGFSAASSFLPYEDRATREFPFLGQGQTLKVWIKPLDDILRNCGAEDIDMLIMDVQGYEDEVIRGAKETLKSCKAVMSELSLQDLYKGSSTFDSVYQALAREEFRLRYLLNPTKGASQTTLQIDGIFVRTGGQAQSI